MSQGWKYSILPELNPIGKSTPLWDDVILPLGFRQNLQRSIIKPVIDTGRPRDFSFIIFGPPGTGKTTVLKSIAKQLSWDFFNIGPQNFVKEGLTVEQAVTKCIAEIKDFVQNKIASQLEFGTNPNGSTIFVFDEIDELVVSRDAGVDRDARFSTTMMLPLLQDLRDLAKQYGFIFFFLTNHIERFDPAITRKGRFDLILPLGPPDRQARFLLFEKFIHDLDHYYTSNNNLRIRTEFDSTFRGIPTKIVKADLDVISRASGGLTLKDIESICNQVVEQRIAQDPKLLDSNARDLIYLETRYFVDWIYRYRSNRQSRAELEKFHHDIEVYTRGSTLYPKANTLQEKVEHEFSSLHLRNNLKELDNKWKFGETKKIIFSYRNLAGLSPFIGRIKILVILGNQNSSGGMTNTQEEHIMPGLLSDSYELEFTPNSSGIMQIQFTIEGYFDLMGIEAVLSSNRAKLHGTINIKRKITIN